MNDQENQLIREATGQNRDLVEPEPEETNDSDQQGETYETTLWPRGFADAASNLNSQQPKVSTTLNKKENP